MPVRKYQDLYDAMARLGNTYQRQADLKRTEEQRGLVLEKLRQEVDAGKRAEETARVRQSLGDYFGDVQGQKVETPIEGFTLEPGQGMLKPTETTVIPPSPVYRASQTAAEAMRQGQPAIAKEYTSYAKQLTESQAEQKKQLATIQRTEGNAAASQWLQANTGMPKKETDEIVRTLDVNSQGYVAYTHKGVDYLNIPDGKGGFKQVDTKQRVQDNYHTPQKLLGPDGQEHLYGWNPQTGKFDVDQGVVKPKGAAQEGTFLPDGSLELNTGQIYTPDDLQSLGETYYKTGKVPSVGRKNSALRSAIVQAGTRIASESGRTGFDVAGSWAETKAQGASLQKQKSNLDFAEAFIDNIDKQLVKAKDRIKEIQKNYPKLVNIPIRKWEESVTGEAERNMVRMWVSEISAETARLSRGNPQSIAEMSTTAIETWDKIHDLDLPLDGLVRLLDETQKSGLLRLDSLKKEYNNTLKETGSGPTKVTKGKSVTVKTDADYDALPSGTYFTGPDGVKRQKP